MIFNMYLRLPGTLCRVKEFTNLWLINDDATIFPPLSYSANDDDYCLIIGESTLGPTYVTCLALGRLCDVNTGMLVPA